VAMRLWAHQAEAAQAACAQLSSGGRATVVAACGTGKTLTGAEVSRRLAPAGRVLVVVPTLELLAQTGRAWAGWLRGGTGHVIGVCSDQRATDDVREAQAEMAHLRAQVITDPGSLARLLATSGRVTVLCTYASLPVITAAHRNHGAPAWDLVIADEAHRSAGHADRSWSMLHRDRLLPAARRLYMTATPRIMPGAGEQVISMDDTAVFGPVVHRLPFARAITDGLLADYRVIVAVTTDAEAAKLAVGQLVSVAGRDLPARMAAAQVALARTIRQHDLRRVITYHQRVASASQFAATFANTIELMEIGDGPRRPVMADYVSGTMTRAARRTRLERLEDPGPGTTVIANARMLAEGVDVPALDAVMFADPKDSVIDTVQAVGRALRRGNRTGKIATIIVPVLIAEAEDTEIAVEGSEFDVVWQVVRALRAHDERLADQLDQARAQLGRRRRPATEASPVAPKWLQANGTPVTAAFTRAIQVRTIRAATSSWPEWHAALTVYRARHGHTRVPPSYRTLSGMALGDWLAGQRRLHGAGQLAEERTAALEALGVIWQPQQENWVRALEHATAYHAAHGDLDIPGNHVTSDGFALGTWLGQRRREYRRGTLAADKTAAFEQLGVTWDNAFDAAWQRSLDRLTRYRATHGHARVPVSYVDPDDSYRLGTWLAIQRHDHRHGALSPLRVTALEELGVIWDAENTSWAEGITHLTRFRQHNGHVRVPATYVDPGDGYQLGAWVARQRARHRRPGKNRNRPLNSEEVAALDQLGMVWDATGARSKTQPGRALLGAEPQPPGDQSQRPSAQRGLSKPQPPGPVR
jgi:superfamily II DNA or RNA helicase